MSKELIDRANDKIMVVYKDSGLSMDEIISSLKQLLSTAQFAQLKVDNERLNNKDK